MEIINKINLDFIPYKDMYELRFCVPYDDMDMLFEFQYKTEKEALSVYKEVEYALKMDDISNKEIAAKLIDYSYKGYITIIDIVLYYYDENSERFYCEVI